MPARTRGTVTIKIRPDADFSKATKEVKSRFKNMAQQAKKLDRGVSSSFKSLAKSIKGKLEAPLKALTKPVAAFTSSAVAGFTKVSREALSFGKSIDDKVGAPLQKLAKVAGPAVGKVYAPFKPLGDKIGSVFKGLSAKVGREFKDVEAAGDKSADDIEGRFKQASKKIVSTFKGTGKAVGTEITSGFKGTRNKIVNTFKGTGDKISGGIIGSLKEIPAKAALIAAGAGAAFAASFNDAVDIANTSSNLADRLGLSQAEADEASKIVEGIFTSKRVQAGLDEITNAVVLVKGEFGDLADVGNDDLERLASGALKISEVFGQDLTLTIKAASGLLANDLVDSADEAFDLITRGLQLSGARGEDLVESFEEYANQLAAVGLDGEKSLNLIIAALEGGARSSDGVADGLKESFLFLTAGSKSTIEAVESIGLSWDDLIYKINTGDGDEVITDIAVAIQGLGGDTEKAAAAQAILGGTFEQIGLNGLEGIAKAQGGIENLDGATERLGENMKKGPIFYLDKLKRIGSIALVDLFERMEPTINRVGTAIKSVVDAVKIGFDGGDTEGLSSNLQTAANFGERLKETFTGLREGWDVFVKSFNGEETGELSGNMQTFADLGEAASGYVDNLKEAFIGLFESLSGGDGEELEGMADTGFRIGEAFKEIGPQVLEIVAAIAAMTPALVELSAQATTVTGYIATLVGWLTQFGSIISPLKFLTTIVPALITAGTGVASFGSIVSAVTGTVSAAFGFALAGFNHFKDNIIRGFNLTKGFVSGAISSMVGTVQSLPGRIRSAASGAWSSIYTGFKNTVNKIIDGWNNISFRVPTINVPKIGKVGGQSVSVRQIPRLARGGSIDRETLAIVGDNPGASSGNPEIVSPKRDIIDALMQALRTVNPMGGGDTWNIDKVVAAPGVDLWEELDRTRRAFGGV